MSAAARPDPMSITETEKTAFIEAIGPTPSQLANLEAYRALLAEWNENMNLVGPSTIETFWNRHALDSAQLVALAPDALTWADLGAGAGLPGIVLAILGKGREGFHVDLVESMAKRCRFLSEVVSQLDLPASVVNERAENLSRPVDIVTARACAPMHRLLGFAEPWMKSGAEGIFLKGQDVVSEMEEAAGYWNCETDVVPSISDPRGRIVRVRRLSRVR
jgi:16S rRNA (guanine527-N7)-methyltransferase